MREDFYFCCFFKWGDFATLALMDWRSQCRGEQKMLPKCLHTGSGTGIHMCTANHCTAFTWQRSGSHLRHLKHFLSVLVLFFPFPRRECFQLVSNTSGCCGVPAGSLELEDQFLRSYTFDLEEVTQM